MLQNQRFTRIDSLRRAEIVRQPAFFSTLLERVIGFTNSGQRFFPGVHGQFQFLIYVAREGEETQDFPAVFGISEPAELGRIGAATIRMHADDLRKRAPDTYAIPDVRSNAEFSVATRILSRYAAFGDVAAGPPVRHYLRELDMGNDRDRFTTDAIGLPLYEGRMIGHFDHRAKTYDSGHGNSSVWTEREFGDPEKAIVPQWRVLPEQVPAKLGDRWTRYRLCFRDVAQPTDARSFIAALVPPGVVCGDKVPTLDFGWEQDWAYLPWLAVANSFVMDWVVRSKLSSPKMSFTLVDSLPFPRPRLEESWVQRAAPLVLRLVCTAPEMTGYWNAMAEYGMCSPVPDRSVPSKALVDEASRELARADLDAIVARDVFDVSREELSGILETFVSVKRRDQARGGSYRTLDLILKAFDRQGVQQADAPVASRQ